MPHTDLALHELLLNQQYFNFAEFREKKIDIDKIDFIGTN
jgi:hypothetical protein